MQKLASVRGFYVSLVLLLVVVLLVGCADEPTPTAGGTVAGSTQTVAPPFPAIAPPTQTFAPVPTATEFQPIPALLPTSTPLPLPYTVPAVQGQPGGSTTPVVVSKTLTPPTTTKAAAKPVTTQSVATTSIGLLAYIQGGDLWTVSTDGTNKHQVSSGGYLAADKVLWSPSRDRIAYIGPTGSLETLDLTGKHAVLYAGGASQSVLDPVWSPSGRYLAFTVHTNETTAIAGGEVWLVDALAVNFKPRKVVDGFAPAWSPDSATLAYATRSQLRDPATLTTPVAKPVATTPTAAPTSPSAPVPYNELAIYDLASNNNRTLTSSANLPPYLGLDNQPHMVETTTLRAAWWSPNGKSVAFSDRQSFVAIINTSGGQPPVMWTGQPGAFAANKLYWLNQGQQPLIIWNNGGADDNAQLGIVLSPGKFTKLTGGAGRADCPALLPGGSLVAYSDNQSTLVVRPDGSIYGLYSGGSCPSWSPDGKALVTVKRGGDGSIVILSPNAAKAVTLQTIKGVDSVYWLKGGGEVVLQGGAGPKGP